jgi:predicted nucleotidyltransferase
MESRQDQFQRLLREAQDDPQIIGLVLTGSRGKGFGSDASDFDVLLVVQPEALQAYRTKFSDDQSWEGFDWWVTSLPELEPVAAAWGEPLAWEILCNERYSFADVSVLLDKTGQVQRLVEEKGGIPEERRLPIVFTALGAYTNSLYRSLKCLRNGNALGARLEAADAIGHALTVIFALEGRHRPYYGYLARELEARPLARFPLPADELLAMLATILESADAGTQQRLLGIIDALGRQAGCGEVFDEWEADYGWMQQYRPPGASP